MATADQGSTVNDTHVLEMSSGTREGSGSLNSESHLDKQEVREGDWICLGCNAHVFGRNISCFRCGAPKPGTNARYGDWVCLNRNCGAHNYARRNSCFKCHVLKGSEKPGDWPCPNCHSNNFASRSECFRCQFPRPPGYVYSNVRPGDWLCPNPSCGSNVFANRDSCFRCSTPRPENAEVASSYSDMRIGDWTCTGCGAMCYANRQTCFRCDKPRPAEFDQQHMMAQVTMSIAAQMNAYQSQGYAYSYPMGFNPYANYYQQPYYQQSPPRPALVQGVMPQQAYKPREQDWMCTSCGEHNFAKRSECLSCKAPRPDQVTVQAIAESALMEQQQPEASQTQQSDLASATMTRSTE